YESLDHVLEKGLKPLRVEEFKKEMKNDEVIVLDTRHATTFTQGFVPGSIFIGLEGRFAEWAGSLVPFDKDILLVTEEGKERESIVRLARVGFDRFKGYLSGGFDAWKKAEEPIDMIIDVEPDEMMMDIPFDENLVVVDVRREPEFAEGQIKGAVNLPLNHLSDPGSMAVINNTDNLYIHCASGYRSVIAASLLKRQGIHNLRNVLGGWNKIQELEKVEVEKERSVLN
ncbi:MAG TPA: rhodanese-like domain-containing protein, partial [Chitinophagaceae bacterium]|nr:rhodanese-like domain-containing protein [Chitinophagaceae bacterium]